MADDPLDYLGVQAPISLSEKPALPVGGPPAVGTAAGPVGGATGPRSSVGTVGGPVSSSGTVRTDASGQPGIPGVAAASALAPEGDDVSFETLLGAGGKVASFLKQLLGMNDTGGDSSTLDPSMFSLGGEGGTSTLSPGAFSLTGEDGATLTPENFTLGKYRLNGPNLPGPLRDQVTQALQAAGLDPSRFSFGGGSETGLDPAAFSLGGEGGGSTLDPANFSLGADMNLDAGAGGGSGGVGLLSLATQLGQLGMSLGNAGNDRSGIGGALVKSAISLLQNSEVQSLMAGQAIGANPFSAAWNAPALANTISEMVDPGPDTNPVTLKRRAGRNSDAINLQQEILQPLFNARTPEDFVSALGTEVGGSTAGDALANAIRQNLSGGWYTDTGHQWLPDPSLLPTLRFLQSLGYAGDTSPKRGDVGGMGEVIAGGGSALVSPSQKAWLASSPSPGAGGDVPQASLGWDSILRDITGAVTGSPVTAPSSFDYAAHVPTGAINTITSQQGDDTVTLPTDIYPQHLLADDSYRSTLQELASAGLMTQDELTKILGMSATPREDWSQAQYEGAQTAGGG